MDQFAKETVPVSLEEEMRRSYLDYAMSVIVGRALPDVRDGLKPVHRRVLYAMHELSNDWNRAYKKSARIVGDVIGKYHPHGDSAVYDTIVRMAQPFSLRYPLVDGQGNFGSVDGDNAAAMRYTEIRMSRIAHELLADIDKETVDFGPNYDESDKSGMRAVIELKRGEVPEVVLNHLYKETQLQDSFGVNMVALMDGQPRLLNVRQMLDAFLRHRREVVVRRTVYDLKRARERGHVLEGLAVAMSNIDEVIALIKAAASPAEARSALMGRAWRSPIVEEMLNRAMQGAAGGTAISRPDGLDAALGLQAQGYRLSEVQAQAILDMRLQRLTALEQDKITGEYHDVMARIADLLDILARPERVTRIISDELTAIRDQFGDDRRSEIVQNAEDVNMEDLITPEDVVVTLSHGGYMKAQPVADYQAQRRGGRGRQATGTKDDDFIEKMFVAHTHDYILCFSSRGRVYWIKVYNVPQGGRQSRGKPIVNLLPLAEGEKINAILAVKAFDDHRFVIMSTADGTVKKTPLSEFSRPRASGIIAIELDPEDYLVGVALTSGTQDVMLFSDGAKAVRFDERDVRPMGRTARGVRGMRLPEGQRVISLLVADESNGQSVLIATENGFGKRTPVIEYTRHGRGTQGMISIQPSDRNGKVVAARLVAPADQIILITTGGVLIRTRVSEVREMGRSTQGVTLIALDSGERLAGLETVVDSDEDAGNGNADAGPEGSAGPDAGGDGAGGDAPAA